MEADGGDLDLEVREGSSTGPEQQSGTAGTATETIVIEWNGGTCNGSRSFWIRVTGASPEDTNAYQLRVTNENLPNS
jgi:hypothetical protein